MKVAQGSFKCRALALKGQLRRQLSSLHSAHCLLNSAVRASWTSRCFRKNGSNNRLQRGPGGRVGCNLRMECSCTYTGERVFFVSCSGHHRCGETQEQHFSTSSSLWPPSDLAFLPSGPCCFLWFPMRFLSQGSPRRAFPQLKNTDQTVLHCTPCECRKAQLNPGMWYLKHLLCG